MSSVAILALSLAVAADPSIGSEQVRAAIQRSLPYIEQQGVWWIENKKCVTCHRVGNMLWSLNDAARYGFDVDREKLAEWMTWSIESTRAPDKEDVPDGAKNADGVSQLLLGCPPDALGAETRDILAGYLTA